MKNERLIEMEVSNSRQTLSELMELAALKYCLIIDEEQEHDISMSVWGKLSIELVGTFADMKDGRASMSFIFNISQR